MYLINAWANWSSTNLTMADQGWCIWPRFGNINHQLWHFAKLNLYIRLTNNQCGAHIITSDLSVQQTTNLGQLMIHYGQEWPTNIWCGEIDHHDQAWCIYQTNNRVCMTNKPIWSQLFINHGWSITIYSTYELPMWTNDYHLRLFRNVTSNQPATDMEQWIISCGWSGGVYPTKYSTVTGRTVVYPTNKQPMWGNR